MTRQLSWMLFTVGAVIILGILSQWALSVAAEELNSPQGEIPPQGAATNAAPSSTGRDSTIEQAYVGANQCFICHRPQTNTWSESKHSHEFTDLSQKYRSDPDCLKCHVTGFGEPNGFAVGTTKDLSVVGCESCHGPGALHIDSAQRFVMANPGEEQKIEQEMRDTIVKVPTDSACVKCHKTHENHPAYDGQPTIDYVAGSGCANPALAVARRRMWTTAVTRGATPYSIKTCGGCHYDQYKQWSTGKHASLSAMLPAKYESDDSCKTCHPTTNLVAASSVSSVESRLNGVACETCHGPGLDHVNFNKQFIAGPPLGPRLESAARNAIRKGKPDSTCVQCHVAESHKVHPAFEEK